mmetsp:Transcript_31543/g.35772  ORF Transcript_31543/g.35772 Transcript_31543/m.35772 type:complete len:177 (+) Transcript_31543:467-997(+)
MAGPISLTPASKRGWNSIGSSVTRSPIAANIATRPCWSSASRYCLTVSKSFPSQNPNGSKFPTGSNAPGRPYAKALESGTKTGARAEALGMTVRSAAAAMEKFIVIEVSSSSIWLYYIIMIKVYDDILKFKKKKKKKKKKGGGGGGGMFQMYFNFVLIFKGMMTVFFRFCCFDSIV